MEKQKKRYSYLWKKTTVLLTALTSLLLSVGLRADRYPVLSLAGSARASALANNFSSVSGDVDNIFLNPAGSYSMDPFDISFSYRRWLYTFNLLQAAGKLRIDNSSNIGIGFASIIYDDIYKTIETDNNFYSSEDKINLGNFVFTGCYNREIYHHFITGINAKIVHESIDQSSASGFGLDLGAIYHFHQQVTLGASIRNIFITDAPLTFQTGLNYKFILSKYIQAALLGDISNCEGEDFQAGIGNEIDLLNFFTLRGGYNTEKTLNNLRFGAGIRYKIYKIDFTYTHYNDLNYIYQVTIGFRPWQTENIKQLPEKKKQAYRTETSEERSDLALTLPVPEEKIIKENPRIILPAEAITQQSLSIMTNQEEKELPVIIAETNGTSTNSDLVFNISEDKNISFGYGKDTISSNMRTLLMQIAESIKIIDYKRIIVCGHTDNIGNPEYNLDLSLERARAVSEILIENKIKKDQLTYEGYGDLQPLTDNSTELARARNRRCEIHVITWKNSEKEEYNYHYYSGLDACMKEKYDIAVAEWEKAARIDPANAELKKRIERVRDNSKQKLQ